MNHQSQEKTDVGEQEGNILLIRVSVLPWVWDTAWQDFKSCLYKNSNVKIESYIQNKENKWVLKWIWEMNAKPYTEKQKAKAKTCIEPSMTNFPQLILKKKKKNKTNNRCLLAQTAPASLVRQWVGSPPPLYRDPSPLFIKWQDWWQKSICTTWVWQ